MSEASVLIVDDDRSIVRLCQRLLERSSFKVFASTDPLEAIKILEARSVDMLLSDIRMPVMDGFELIEKAKSLQPDIAVLVMTGFGTIETAIQALYRGVDGLILKPFENSGDVVKAVQRVLDDVHHKQDAVRAQALRPLFDVTAGLLSETDIQALEKQILDAQLDLFQAQSAGLFGDNLDVQSKGELKLLFQRGVPQEDSKPAWNYLAEYLSHLEDSVLINLSGPGDLELQDALRELGWTAILAVPMRRNDSRFVFFSARSKDFAGFRESDRELLTILARQCVVALDNARLYTDLRNYIHRIEESQRALVQAEKMAAVGRLMASLAHEINNPLQAVRNCLHLANRPDIDEKQRSGYLAMTDSELDRLVNTVRHMLDFYRPGLQTKENVDVRGAVERVLHLLQSQLELQGVSLDLRIPPDCPPVYGMRDQIQQVFFNLLLNSMDAMEGIEHEKCIWVEAYPCGDNICIYFEDSGSGIPPEMSERLFEPFVSSKKNGTGLGLAVSYEVVESHGGSLSLAEPRHGSGACFEIHLPTFMA